MSDKPAKKFRIGFITATIWKNNGTDRAFYTVDLSRTYKDGTEFKNTNQLNHPDLMNAARLLTKAENWIAEQ
ncbi:hypothetical protein SAMN04488077_1208 [Roseovarius tolerans]|uniref:Uncharacterized protein n=1 Tax=Roseovarius tolerans TaxID=74031 RepID=A0A1H8HE12_9RHOB|nr:hypothetical protein [Roseovarius tolerans]SEN54239.1 hypothetical protein SAMN04488077_1208 [Roseovarius tolerans]